MRDASAAIEIPKRGFAPIASLLGGMTLPALIARFAINRARRKGRPLKLGKRVLAVRHVDVLEMLRRDLDFIIAPVNESRIKAVNGGNFILGMDRCPRLMREREALYRALAVLDLSTIRTDVHRDAQARIAVAGTRAGFDGIADYARPIAAATASRIFGIAPPDMGFFADVVRAIFAHTFLNIGNDQKVAARAVTAGGIMQDWLAQEMLRRHAGGDLGTDLMGHLLRAGELDDDAVRRTLGGMLVGSIDTTASTFARIFCVVDRDQRLRERVSAAWRNGDDIYGLCLDALRRWPHNPILLREAAVDTALGGVAIKKGTTVIAWTQAAMQDPERFPEPSRILPDRPMDGYLHFGAGLHPCAGRMLNAVQIPIMVGLLVEAGGRRAGGMGWAGPFPAELPVSLDGGHDNEHAIHGDNRRADRSGQSGDAAVRYRGNAR